MLKRTVILNGRKIVLGEQYTDTLLYFSGYAEEGRVCLSGRDAVKLVANDTRGHLLERWVPMERVLEDFEKTEDEQEDR